MEEKRFTNPFYIFFLVLPYGISVGFATVTLPYLLTQNGFPVATTAAIVSIGVSANIWRFLWAPVADLTLSLRKWYWIGVFACTATLLWLCLTPFNLKGQLLLTIIVFISQVASTFVVLPVGGFMAHRITENKKGMAGGFYQAGNLGGVGIGGGAGLWLSTHINVMVAGLVLCAVSVLCGLVVLLIKDVENNKENSIAHQTVVMGKDLMTMIRIPIVLFAMIVLLMPMGTGAAANLFSAITGDWKVNVDSVALVTGLLFGIVSAIGCVIGGYIADKLGVWSGYLIAVSASAASALLMAALPYLPPFYIGGVLVYAFGLGLVNATFSALALYATGKRNASTKYALLSSLANIPIVYMTNVDGWAHDKYGSKAMLLVESAICFLFVATTLIFLKRLKNKGLLLKFID